MTKTYKDAWGDTLKIDHIRHDRIVFLSPRVKTEGSSILGFSVRTARLVAKAILAEADACEKGK